MSGILSFIAISVLTIGVGLYVAWPLLFGSDVSAAENDHHEANRRLEANRLRAELRDLELDHSLDKIPHEDYEAQRSALVAELSAIDEPSEQEPALTPETRETQAASAAEERIKAARARVRVSCSECGSTNPRSASFCNACGAKLSGQDKTPGNSP